MVAPFLVDPRTADTSPFESHASATLRTPTLRIVDHDMIPDSRFSTLERLATPPTSELTAELDGAAAWLDLTASEIILAALGRTIARTIGDGVVGVDVTGERHWLLQPLPLVCATADKADATDMLGMVRRALAAGVDHPAQAPSEIFVNNAGEVSDAPLDEIPPGLGYALELRVYRMDGEMHLDWWYDTSRFDAYTVEELMEQFRLSLFEMTSDASPLG
jgi:hypothetical protein